MNHANPLLGVLGGALCYFVSDVHISVVGMSRTWKQLWQGQPHYWKRLRANTISRHLLGSNLEKLGLLAFFCTRRRVVCIVRLING